MENLNIREIESETVLRAVLSEMKRGFTSLENRMTDTISDKVEEHMQDVRLHFKPKHKDKLDITNDIKRCLGDDSQEGELEHIQQRLLMKLGYDKWQDIPFQELPTSDNFKFIDEMAISIKKHRTKQQIDIFEKVEEV